MTTTDELLKELQGDTTTQITSPDGETAGDASQRDPLDVAPQADTRSATTKADAKHAIKAGGKGYEVVVAGEYYTHSSDSTKKIVKPYELSFNLPSLEGALSVIVGKLLVPKLQKFDAQALTYRTHEIIRATPLTPDTPPTTSLQFMDQDRLERYIADNAVPINPEDYSDVVHLRESVIDHQLNPNGFEKREAIRQADRAKTRELLAMNPDLDPVKSPEA